MYSFVNDAVDSFTLLPRSCFDKNVLIIIKWPFCLVYMSNCDNCPVFMKSARALVFTLIAKISVTSPIVVDMPAGELLAGGAESSFVWRFRHLNGGSNVCGQISSLFAKWRI